MSRSTFSAWAGVFKALAPLARSIDENLGLGQAGQRANLTEARIQYTHIRSAREVARERREQSLFELKYAEMQNKLAQQENQIARQSLEIDRLRKEMGLDAPHFEPTDY